MIWLVWIWVVVSQVWMCFRSRIEEQTRLRGQNSQLSCGGNDLSPFPVRKPVTGCCATRPTMKAINTIFQAWFLRDSKYKLLTCVTCQTSSSDLSSLCPILTGQSWRWSTTCWRPSWRWTVPYLMNSQPLTSRTASGELLLFLSSYSLTLNDDGYWSLQSSVNMSCGYYRSDNRNIRRFKNQLSSRI